MLDGKKLWMDNTQGMVPGSMEYPSVKMRGTMEGMYFSLARYHFSIRMLANRENATVLDLGCNTGQQDRFIEQKCNLDRLIGVDFDGRAIQLAKEEVANEKMYFIEDDFLGKDYRHHLNQGNRPRGGYTCVISMDVIEHIPKEKEDIFVDTVVSNLAEDGFAVIGTPNATLYPYANEWNKARHINNYDQNRLYKLLNSRFEQVFIFGMNDEVLNTGFYPFSCYILALCCQKK